MYVYVCSRTRLTTTLGVVFIVSAVVYVVVVNCPFGGIGCRGCFLCVCVCARLRSWLWGSGDGSAWLCVHQIAFHVSTFIESMRVYALRAIANTFMMKYTAYYYVLHESADPPVRKRYARAR